MSADRRSLLPPLAATLLMLLVMATVFADDFPGGKPNQQILHTQQKVDELFERGNYERAYFIYRQELAPLGDKYAQYMVGYMNIVGKGVARDYIAGSAWYRLAAERGGDGFKSARDEVLDQFSDEQQRQSDVRYAELRLQFSDAMIVTNLIEADLDALAAMAAADGSLSLSADTDDDVAAANASQERLLRNRVALRLDYLRNKLVIGNPLTKPELERIIAIQKRAKEEV